MIKPKAVTLVPRREGIADRDALWAFCQNWWQENLPNLPIIEGHHNDGPFNRSAAINKAAKAATILFPDVNVFIILDGDILCPPENVYNGVEIAFKKNVLVVPFETRNNLSLEGTSLVLSGYKGSWEPYIESQLKKQHSSIIMVSRVLWERVGGFDEGFNGWGQEDTAFFITCKAYSGNPAELPGSVWHLFHEFSPAVEANYTRLKKYKEAKHNRFAISRIKASR